MEKKRIVYIMGLGRSGTTLLEILLSNPATVFACGELNRYPKRGGIPPQYSHDDPRYVFWSSITQKMNVSEAQLRALDILHQKFEYHAGFIHWYWGMGTSEKAFQNYAEFLQHFYNTIFQQAAQPIITDSSKYPGRALNLSRALAEYDISYVYIQRDPVSVIKSFAKQDLEQPPKNWFAANLYYGSVSWLCQLAFAKLSKKHACVKVKYEDLINDPVKLLKQIQAGIGLDLSDSIALVEKDGPLKVKYLFDGNRIRLQQEIKLVRGKSDGKLQFKDYFVRWLHSPFYRK